MIVNKGEQLLKDTIHLLRTRPATLNFKEIADNIQVSIQWIKLISTNGVDNPSIIKIGKLHAYLEQKIAEVKL